MQLSSLLGHAQELLALIRESGRPADGVIDSFFRSRKYLGSNDRRFIAESVYGTLRHLRRSELLLWKSLGEQNQRIGREDGLLLLIVTYLISNVRDERLSPADIRARLKSGPLKDSIPGLLQRLQKTELDSFEDTVERIAVTHSFPDWLVRKLVDQYGEAEAERLCGSLNEQATTTLRVNTLKGSMEECQEALRREGVETVRTSLSPFGLAVAKRINMFQLASFREGLFEVQDEGSQLLPLFVDPKPTVRILDACAGAGGKTLLFSALMKKRGEIVATDVHNRRLEELRKRARRAGAFNIRPRLVKQISDLWKDSSSSFDTVFIDAPCSGLGTIRRNPGLKWTVTEESIRELSKKQKRLLDESAPLVKVGGRLVYATCTLLHEENEEVIEEFLVSHPRFQIVDPSEYLQKWNLVRLASGKYVKLMPHRDGTDGFFFAMLQRVR
jgi:16S rRNA (cytosine967-C5)-methyltransferase